MIAVLEFALDETGQVVERNILSDHHTERASAVALIEGEISKYPSHGYYEEHRYWWGRDAAGEIHRFAIITPDEPFDPVPPITPGSKP
jgi:hypothetical protein